MTLPLEKLVVVELGHSVAAPIAGLILAELGAQVVKVENPGGGDDARSFPFQGEASHRRPPSSVSPAPGKAAMKS